ncbi:hypothetical protein CPC16_003262 [Podila verticillata]|nr:hypothetical protein CPC16_003262 [Podila verticillata]
MRTWAKLRENTSIKSINDHLFQNRIVFGSGSMGQGISEVLDHLGITKVVSNRIVIGDQFVGSQEQVSIMIVSSTPIFALTKEGDMAASNVSNQQNIPRIVLGAGTFGLESTDCSSSFVRLQGAKAVQPLVDLFKSHGYVEVDTARVYTDSEAVLGQLDKSTLAGLKISTKVHPRITPLTKENVLKQFNESLTNLGVEHVDVLYLHMPDDSVPYEETLQAVDTLYKQGKFREFGLSNFSARQIEEIVAICKAKGYIAPTVYQGLHSPIARADYLAHHGVLKKYGIRYYAYGAMASGLLSGKHKFDEEPNADTRLHSSFSERLKQQYWHREVFAALDLLTKAADKEGISLAQATNRWMRHHSGLTKEDAVLVGVSSLRQLEQNIHDLEMGPLPPVLVDAFEDSWKAVEHIQIILVPSALDNKK